MYDFIILNETWIKEQEINMFTMPGYKGVFNCRADRKGGGTAIYIKDIFSFTIKKLSKMYNEIQIQVENVNKPFYLMTLYRPSTDGAEETKKFIEHMERTLDANKRTLCIGDFNFDLLNLKKKYDKNTRDYKDIIECSGYKILNKIDIENATRVTSSSTTLRDHAI